MDGESRRLGATHYSSEIVEPANPLYFFRRVGYDARGIQKYSCTISRYYEDNQNGTWRKRGHSRITLTIRSEPHGQRPRQAERDEEETGKNNGGKTG